MKELDHLDWVKIAESPEFVELHQRKRRFLFGWWVAAVLFFFTIPLGAGYLPSLYQYKIIGNINFAYILGNLYVLYLLVPVRALYDVGKQGLRPANLSGSARTRKQTEC